MEWHPTKNGDLTPYNVVAGSDLKVWWKCDVADDHEWEATIDKRTSGRGCSCCCGFTVVKSNCLATTCPELAAQWHPTKNGDLKPENFTAGSNKRILCKIFWL